MEDENYLLNETELTNGRLMKKCRDLAHCKIANQSLKQENLGLKRQMAYFTYRDLFYKRCNQFLDQIGETYFHWKELLKEKFE